VAAVLPDPAGAGAASDDADEADDSVRLAAVQRCNEAMLAKAAGRTCCGRRGGGPARRSANVSYPTDSGLLAKAIRRMGPTGRRIQAARGDADSADRPCAEHDGPDPFSPGVGPIMPATLSMITDRHAAFRSK
jgi:hypothetical protein